MKEKLAGQQVEGGGAPQTTRKNLLFKHKMTAHKNENVKFKMEITGQFKDALTRQTNEAVRILDRSNHEVLNSKSEFNHPATARVIIEKKKMC